MRTEIYYNLHKKTFSVRRGGKVHCHADFILIHEPRFVVQPAGQRRVRASGRKNVHAFVVADSLSQLSVHPFGEKIPVTFGWDRVEYNPHRDPGFMMWAHRPGLRVPFHKQIVGASIAVLIKHPDIPGPRVEACDPAYLNPFKEPKSQ